MLVFEERGKPEYSEKTSLEKNENQQQTQPTYDAEWRWLETSALNTAPSLLPIKRTIARMNVTA